jgi:serine/threonine protein kinase
MDTDTHADQKLTNRDANTLNTPNTRRCPRCSLDVSVTQTSCPADGTPLDGVYDSGTILDGKYEFIQLIGSGGMGVIYKARQIVLNKIVAIKMLHSEAINERALKRFQREGKAASALSHSNIITVYDFSISSHNEPYLVMEYVEGQSLEEKIQEEGLLDVDFTLQAILQVCDGLSHAHKNGILHRDLKPSNILIVKDDEDDTDKLKHKSGVGFTAKILDFGIAKIVEGNNSASMALTKTGETIGSPLYMSPEQCDGKPMDKRSELYMVGCTLYECLTGLPPFVGPSLANIIVKISNEDPPSLKDGSLGKDFSPALEGIIMKLLRKNPDERYQSVDELKWDLQNFQESPPDAQPTRVVMPPQKPVMNKTKVIISGAVCLIALVLVGLTIQYFSRQIPATVMPIVPVKVTGFDSITGGANGARLPGQPSAIRAALQKWVRTNPNANTINLGYWEITDDDMPPLKEESACLSLNLPGNSIKGDGLKYIEQMKGLTTLRIDKNDVDDSALKHLQHLSHLTSLNLKRTRVTGSGLSYIAGLPLTYLDISNSRLNPAAVAPLKELSGLSDLVLTGTEFNDHCVVYLASMNNLRVLDLSHTKVTSLGVSRLSKLENLRDLCLTGCAIDDSVMKSIAHMKNLNRLDVSGTNVTARGLRQLAASKNVQAVYCAGCQGDLISAAAEIDKRLPNCQLIPTPRPGT